MQSELSGENQAPVVAKKMSITLDNSDFQFLQDQLVDLKNKNYELAEKNRRGQADFEAAKAKICSLQLKLEEQERDFQITSTTLRREIEVVSGADREKDDDYKIKYKKVLVKAKEIQQRYEKSLEIVQQLETQNKDLVDIISKLEEEKTALQEKLESIESKPKSNDAIDDAVQECEKLKADLTSAISGRDTIKEELDKANAEIEAIKQKLESHTEERKIHEKKGIQIVKELKRQLSQEKSQNETLQKRIQELLSQPPTPLVSDIETSKSHHSASSSTNDNSNSSKGSGGRANHDISSVGSWSFVPPKCKQGNVTQNETLSLCSIDSEDRETVQHPCDTGSEDSIQRNSLIASDSSRQSNKPSSISDIVASKQAESPAPSTMSKQSVIAPILAPPNQGNNEALLLEEQAALVDRLTKMQHDKWMLEEKLSYLEQANSSLSEDLANKSHVIKNYFMNQALKQTDTSGVRSHGSSRRTSIPGNINHILTERPSLKKVVDFLKERSQMPALSESDNLSWEATKKMQVMLEETLIKCIKLQENLDHVTNELNKLKS